MEAGVHALVKIEYLGCKSQIEKKYSRVLLSASHLSLYLLPESSNVTVNVNRVASFLHEVFHVFLQRVFRQINCILRSGEFDRSLISLINWLFPS